MDISTLEALPDFFPWKTPAEATVPPVLSVVAPAYNEEEVISEFCVQLRERLETLRLPWEIIIVDDGSGDRTRVILLKLAQDDARIKVVSLQRNYGHQIALHAGIEYATGEYIVTMDSDLQHPPEALAEMLNIAVNRGDVDIVYALPSNLGQYPFPKRLLDKCYYWFLGRLSETRMIPQANDFRLITRRMQKALLALPERTRYLRGLIPWTGFNFATTTYQMSPRGGGRSKYNPGRIMKLALDGITSMSTRPLGFALWLGLSVLLAAGLYFAYILAVLFLNYLGITHTPIEKGWASLILAVLIMGGTNLCLLGFAGLYIGKIYDEIKLRPLYYIRDLINLSEKHTP